MNPRNAGARSIFKNISPLDHRYSLSESEVYEALSEFLSEEAGINACAKAEAALVIAHLEMRGVTDNTSRKNIEDALKRVTPDDVYAEEEKTRHAIRALVNVMKRTVPADSARLVHLGATSADILDSAFSWQIKNAVLDVVLPLLFKLENALCLIAEREAETPQVGRTHGQHAVPITAGFAFAEYVSRLGKSIKEIEKRARELRGKLAGAVGAYNATGMIYKNPRELERRYLNLLGLEASEHSTQLVEPEYLLRLLLECGTAFGIIANLADDLRNLQRSEIGEACEGFSAEQVGSSTMPQKRNPWNSEHVKSLWKEFMPRIMTFFMDQISEHQRDLTNSASKRFIGEYLTGFSFAVRRMTFVLEGLRFDKERLLANLSGDGILAEPAYILLAECGLSDAHEVIRRVTLRAESEGVSFAKALGETEIDGCPVLDAIEGKMRELGVIREDETAADFFERPERYRGLSAEIARALAAKFRREI